jgi:hypothetical protein
MGALAVVCHASSCLPRGKSITHHTWPLPLLTQPTGNSPRRPAAVAFGGAQERQQVGQRSRSMTR